MSQETLKDNLIRLFGGFKEQSKLEDELRSLPDRVERAKSSNEKLACQLATEMISTQRRTFVIEHIDNGIAKYVIFRAETPSTLAVEAVPK